MITPITATFPALNFPKEVDYPTQEDWAAFSAAAELNYGILSGAWSDKSEEFKAQTNNLAQEIQEIGENAFNAISLNTIEDLATYTGTGLVMVKDINRGGIFISRTESEIDPNTGILYVANDVTVFDGISCFWERHNNANLDAKWAGAEGNDTNADMAAIQKISYLKNKKYASPAPTVYDIFVIYGQSNAFGFAENNSIYRGDIPDYTYFWTNRVPPSKWNKMVHDLTFIQAGTPDSTGGAWVEFARSYIKETGRGVLYIPAAMGGKSLVELSKGSIYYTAMISAYNQSVIDTSFNIGNKYMLFHQGESDMTNGTSRESYQTLLGTFWTDIKTDTDIEKLFVFKVGSPQDRPEISRSSIQVAQDYVVANTIDMVLAFDGCSAFTKANYCLMSDGVHYTQLGYNLMGSKGGETVAKAIINKQGISEISSNHYNFLCTPSDVQHRLMGATLYTQNGQWVLKNLSDGGRFRASLVTNITVESNRILLTLSSRMTDIIGFQSNLNSLAMSNGLFISVEDGTVNNQLVLTIFADITAFVDTTTGAISYSPNGTGINTGLLGDLTCNIDEGISKLTYLGSNNAPVVSSYSSSSLTNTAVIAQRVVSSSSVWFKYIGTPTDNRAVVTFSRKLVNPSLIILNGLLLNVTGIIGERSL